MTKQQKLVLWVAILASFVAFLDGSVTNVALPAISRDLGGGLATQQWVVDAYLLTLSALILTAGSLSDLFGRKRILMFGLFGFGAASLLCALAPTSEFLIIMRGLQGIAGALLVPSSLALIMAGFDGPPEGKAIGTWTAWTGISYLIGPVLGGFLIDVSSWRLIFVINIIPIAITLWIMRYLQPEKVAHKQPRLDAIGGLLGMVSLGLLIYGLIEQPHLGWPGVFPLVVAGLVLLAGFVWYESRASQPMLRLDLFKIRNFSYGNITTFAVYGGLGVATFLVTIFLQQVGGFSAFYAGLALLPVTLIMFLFSSFFGALAGKFGPRIFMTVGPIVAALGFLLLMRVEVPVDYWLTVLPGVVLFGLGLAVTVAPLTTAILGSVQKSESGIASAVNNATARASGMILVAGVGAFIGQSLQVDGFRRGLVVVAGSLILGGALSWIGIRNPRRN